MKEKTKRDPGQYIGHEPELAADRIPGGVQPKDERVASHSTQSGPPTEPQPSGHREGAPVVDDQVREAGQDR
jgi:hypothetical protein